MSFFNEINCNNAKEFLELITPWSTPYKLNSYVFRGHSDANFKLHPNILRIKNNPDLIKIAKLYLDDKGKYYEQITTLGPTNIQLYHSTIELNILRRFYKISNENGLYIPRSNIMSLRMESLNYIGFDKLLKASGHSTWLNEDTTEVAALAQHYGLPTRLIDWSYNQYVAAFFASNLNKKANSEKKIAIWMLNYYKLNNLFSSPFSDVKIFSPHYQWNQNAKSQRGLFTYIESTHNKESQALVKDYFDDYELKKTFSRSHKYSSVKTDYRTLDIALKDAIDRYNQKKTSEIDPDGSLIKITLPQSEAASLNKYLREMKISESSIFPGYSGVADDLKSVLTM